MPDSWTKTFIRTATSVGAVNIVDRLATVALGIFLARTLAPEGYGAYAFIMSQITLLALVAKLGLPELVLRDFSAARGLGGNGWQPKLLGIALALAAAASLGIIAIGFVLIELLAVGPDRDLFLFGLLMVALMAFFEIYAGALRGLGKAIAFQLITTLGLTSFVLLVSAAFLALFGAFEPFDALAIRATGLVVMTTIVIILVRQQLQITQAHQMPVPPSRISPLATLKTSVSFMVIGMLHLVFVSIDQLMLGYMIGVSSVGIFKVAAEGAQIVAFAYVAGNAVLAPEFSRIFASGDMVMLENAARRSAAIVVAIATPLFVVIAGLAEPLITLAFGADYAGAATPLAILAVGHFLALFFGDPLYILNMTGHHWLSMRITLAALLLNVVLNVMAIPAFGVLGAAAATSVSFVALRLAAYFCVRWRLRIECSAISGFKHIRKTGLAGG